ncbi:MAG TPA: 3-oxoacyl-ACP reductase, partial [Rhodospirillaceae bacterium]|nr:3-oxoacyl-ACP reductase [Rhodospirillaceae bacterium]
INVLVNNAAVAEMGKFDDFSIEDWNKTIDINVTGVFHMIQAALPYLRKVKGNIVNVSSVSGIGGDWGLAAYNASKGAVTNFTRALALELGRDGIRVNAVNPSLTITEMTAGLADDKEVLAKFAERMPLGKPAQPIDIARVINFLASDEAGFVNGVNLPVDGGVSASNGQPPIHQ